MVTDGSPAIVQGIVTLALGVAREQERIRLTGSRERRDVCTRGVAERHPSNGTAIKRHAQLTDRIAPSTRSTSSIRSASARLVHASKPTADSTVQTNRNTIA